MPPGIKLAITGDVTSDPESTDDISALLEGYEVFRAPEIFADAAVADEVEVLVRGLEFEDAGADKLLET